MAKSTRSVDECKRDIDVENEAHARRLDELELKHQWQVEDCKQHYRQRIDDLRTELDAARKRGR